MLRDSDLQTLLIILSFRTKAFKQGIRSNIESYKCVYVLNDSRESKVQGSSNCATFYGIGVDYALVLVKNVSLYINSLHLFVLHSIKFV